MPAEIDDAESYQDDLIDFTESKAVNQLNTNLTVKKCEKISLNTTVIHDSSNSYQTPFTYKSKIIDKSAFEQASSDLVPCSMDSESLANFQTIPICLDSVGNKKQYTKKSLTELRLYSLDELKVLLNDLSKTVEDASNQLVQLLLENDALQQESDARNIAIEQLLKITVKVTENELKPIQMSVILSPEDCESSV